MPDRLHTICLMSSSLDGGLHASRCTKSPDGTSKDWAMLYEALHDRLAGDAWLVGRATMAEMAKGEANPLAAVSTVQRTRHFAKGIAKPFAITVDTRGELHFGESKIAGDDVVVLLGKDVSDTHLAELAASGVSYIVSVEEQVDLKAALRILRDDLGVTRLLVEGGAAIVGSFLAEGLVDELNVIVTPTLDARADMQAFVSYGRDGLAGKTSLSLKRCDRLDHGAVLLCYDVRSVDGR